MDTGLINAFLHFGYLPSPDEALPFSLESVPRGKEEHVAGDRLKRGADLLKGAIARTADPDQPNVVPLSGGLDSRALLAALVEAGYNVATVTFGTPGTYDFDIARRVARSAGVQHETIDLTRIRLSTDALVTTARSMPHWSYLLDAFYNRLVPERFGQGVAYISGYLGDPLAGSHLGLGSTSDWGQALKAFCNTQNRSRSYRLTPADYDARELLPSNPANPPLSCYEELDFRVRQTCCIRSIVLPAGYDYRTPFLDEQWVKFMLSAPEEQRRGQRLYRAVLKHAWPELFKLPTKNDFGLPMSASKWRRSLARAQLRAGNVLRRSLRWSRLGPLRMLNYIDMDEAIRRRTDVREVIGSNVSDLKRRAAADWLDPDEIWRRHQSRRADHGDALTVLAELELYLKAEEMGE